MWVSLREDASNRTPLPLVAARKRSAPQPLSETWLGAKGPQFSMTVSDFPLTWSRVDGIIPLADIEAVYRTLRVCPDLFGGSGLAFPPLGDARPRRPLATSNPFPARGGNLPGDSDR